jgi:hypothetical protein
MKPTALPPRTATQPRRSIPTPLPIHKVSRQAQALIEIMRAATAVLGPRTRGIYLVTGEDDDAATIRKLLKRASGITAELADRLAAAVASEQALARLRAGR